MSYLAPFPSYRGALIQIIAFDNGISILLPRSKLWTAKFDLKTRNIILSRGVYNMFR